MSYTNSKLVEYTRLSPNNSGTRTHAIDRITPHCVVGQCTIETLGAIFAPTSRQASSNYGIGKDGKIGMFVPESKRSWCSSSNANDQRAITIECASDSTEPYAFNDTVYKRLIELCVDICRRNGKTKLLWISDKAKALAYEPKSNEMLLTVHRWFANKSCPGNWLYSRMGDLANKVNAQLDVTPEPTKTGYLVKVTTLLNVRKGPGVEYDAWYIKGQTPIPSGGIYTIVDEATAKDGGKWGLLKAFSEQRNGWINLGYTKKV
ncbi:MAG: N-acetylmuramoyl-L-alanine amidase [Lachnospiraceae bacterium]|nr:N-acetylmuramoyl-L-alanine amidase [Clostridiales bacterium]MBR0305494.1 N-acetylmuramoyl-L-alanine amidase [Lachnospiraceae bacterium]